MSIVIQDKRDECDRVINNISSSLPAILSTQLHLQSLTSQDFSQLMKLIRDNYTQVHPHLLSEFNIDDINKCIKIRNILYHQNITSPQFLTNAISSLYKCQKAFGIQSALVPIRVLACKKCDTTITRSAQPTVVFKDTANINQRITRTYDVQSWVVANDNTEFATRENTWYPGWVRTYTYCAECRRQNIITRIGFRYDWAPEDRIDLNICRVRYMLERQAMVVVYPDGSIRDLIHVVSDGEVKRHRYALYEKELKEVAN